MSAWKESCLGDLIKESKIPVLNDDPSKRLTVKLNCGGVEKRLERSTDQVGNTKYFRRSAGQFIYGKQNLHNGAVGIIPRDLDGYSSSQDIPAFDLDKRVIPKWFLYYFQQKNFYKGLERIANGTGSKRIQPKQLFEVKILIPPINEQLKIVEILENFEKVLKLNNLKENIYRKLIQATINELTFKKNFDFYENFQLGDILENSRLKTKKDLPIFSVSLNLGVVPRNQLGRNVITDMNNDGYLHVFKGDLCYNMMRMWQGASGIAPKECLISPAYIVCRPSPKINQDYLGLICKSSNLIKEFRLSSRGITSDRWRLYYEDFAKIKIELPSLEKQIEIVSRVKNQKNLLDRLKQKTHVISNLKISLLDELLSGQKRVI